MHPIRTDPTIHFIVIPMQNLSEAFVCNASIPPGRKKPTISLYYEQTPPKTARNSHAINPSHYAPSFINP
ncbi:hypothetical protein AciX9_2644 [Granulicella tundricola MP5ACTX9]|uniref:Uncharacterized protein n=1 Tax=Granulicella tundricola (strain ATCC BAA-1859 / DSM 23138 / MP5ACTX9) TaxID=1198114 RepID=E8WWK5_GRATM|nr:hypothetical protein AciX9_2644 [Granulicella tundricola MP5ACTX9]